MTWLTILLLARIGLAAQSAGRWLKVFIVFLLDNFLALYELCFVWLLPRLLAVAAAITVLVALDMWFNHSELTFWVWSVPWLIPACVSFVVSHFLRPLTIEDIQRYFTQSWQRARYVVNYLNTRNR